MGSGKTTLITEICKQLGVMDLPSSPTYSIINEYKTKGDDTIYHLDLYRIKDVDEAIQAGVEDVLYSGNICFIEWPTVAKELLPEGYINVLITLIDANTREIKMEKK
jgi:tRNA threonylcarbamoyladenosine biosynthesis protein TsaE